jgi:hypothetical protein
MFSSGLCIQVALKLIFQMKSLVQKQKQFKEIFFRKDSLKLAFFLGGFSGFYKVN